MVYSKTENINVVILEEQELYRHVYKTSFDNHPTIKLVGILSDRNKCNIQADILANRPDVMVFSVKSIDLQTIKDMEDINSSNPNMGFVFLITNLNMIEAEMFRKIAQKCKNGMAIYLKQSIDDVAQLHDIIVGVKFGQVILDSRITSVMFKDKVENKFLMQLSRRETEILNLLANGYTNQHIANALFIEVKTVEHHLNSIYAKLKTEDGFDQRHPRVNVARLYLETTGELVKSGV